MIAGFQAARLLGSSPAFAQALALIQKLGRIDVPVLIEGETGTGKELAARAIHYCGNRRDHPFVPVNCGSFPDALVESELFGHVKGAFTDARLDKPGLIVAARGGTMFLDEVDALSPRAQVALLRFLQDWSYRPVGAHIESRADVRIIAATNGSLELLTKAGQFRMDLLYRLKVLSLRLPPLRERGDDVFVLARHFFETCRLRYEPHARAFDERSCSWLSRYGWPGNVRELENLVVSQTLLCDAPTLALIPPETFLAERRTRDDRRIRRLDGMTFSTAKAAALARFESDYLIALMVRAHGNVSQAARLAGKERRALGKLLKKHGVTASGFEQA